MARQARVSIDHQVCVDTAMCIAVAPRVFALNAERQAEAVHPGADSVETILEAAESRPVSAILAEDAETGELLFPYPSVR